MFYIDDNYIASSQNGGKYGASAIKKLGVYLLLLSAFVFDIVGPLTETKAQEKFKANRELFTAFTIFSVIIPLLIIYFIWISNGQNPSKKKGTVIAIIIFLLLQFATTIAALVYSGAFGEENVKIRALFYLRISFLYIGMIWSVMVAVQGKK